MYDVRVRTKQRVKIGFDLANVPRVCARARTAYMLYRATPMQCKQRRKNSNSVGKKYLYTHENRKLANHFHLFLHLAAPRFSNIHEL